MQVLNEYRIIHGCRFAKHVLHKKELVPIVLGGTVSHPDRFKNWTLI
ncbi:hypothetical protein SPHV1_2080002 [Novosphingobium sp. KN65.2]|nr:hypothetical protein SPHV1_2080002 [Novosphingobium sp. KN65.2]